MDVGQWSDEEVQHEIDAAAERIAALKSEVKAWREWGKRVKPSVVFQSGDGWWNCLVCRTTWKDNDPDGEYHVAVDARSRDCPMLTMPSEEQSST